MVQYFSTIYYISISALFLALKTSKLNCISLSTYSSISTHFLIVFWIPTFNCPKDVVWKITYFWFSFYSWMWVGKPCVVSYEHMERMEEDSLMKKIIVSDVRGVRLRRRPWMGWMDGVKRIFNKRVIYVEQRKMIVHDRGKWREVVNDTALIILDGGSHATGVICWSYQVQRGRGSAYEVPGLNQFLLSGTDTNTDPTVWLIPVQ